MGNPIAWEAWARQGRLRLQHLRDIILSGTTQTQPALQQEVTLLLDSMPASWAAHVCGPAPQPTHLVSAAAGDSRVFCPDAEGQLIHTYTVTPTAALQPALPLPEAADLRPVLVMDWDPTRPWHPPSWRRRRGSGTASASATAGPQDSPRWCLVSWRHRPQILAASLPTSMSSGRGPAACARCDAPLQACQTPSAPCGQPSGHQSTVMSTAASVALSLVGQQHGIIASRSSPRQVPRATLVYSLAISGMMFLAVRL